MEADPSLQQTQACGILLLLLGPLFGISLLYFLLCRLGPKLGEVGVKTGLCAVRILSVESAPNSCSYKGRK